MLKMSTPISSLESLIKHPIFLIAVFGIVLRLAIFPLVEVGYDSDYWAIIIRNLDSGEGLYGLEGYYYTPIWGYILSFLSFIQEALLNIDVMGVRVPAAFPAEVYSAWYSASVTSVAFNVFVKTPMLISDLIVGYLVYWLIKDMTQDTKKATIGFTLWFLCPLIICATSVSGMFDTISVLFIMLCIVMIRKDKLFLAGVLFSFAVLTKFFPAYLAFILMAYILVNHRDDGKAVRSLAMAVAGALLAFLVIMAPQIADGTLAESFLFITTRATVGGTATLFQEIASKGAIILFGAAVVVAIALGHRLTKKTKDELDASFFRYALLIMAFLFLYPPLPQYLVILIPFLAIFIVTENPRLKWSWLLVSVGAAFFIFNSNALLLLSFGTFTDLMSLEHIMSMAEWFRTPGLLGISPWDIIQCGGVIQCIGVLSVFGFFIMERYARRKDGKGERRRFSLWRSSSCK